MNVGHLYFVFEKLILNQVVNRP